MPTGNDIASLFTFDHERVVQLSLSKRFSRFDIRWRKCFRNPDLLRICGSLELRIMNNESVSVKRSVALIQKLCILCNILIIKQESR